MFKNKVGRPSNDILKKRRIFKIIIAIIIILIISVIIIIVKERQKEKINVPNNKRTSVNNNINMNPTFSSNGFSYTLNTIDNKVNSKYKNVYAFNYYTDSRSLYINAINLNNDIIPVITLKLKAPSGNSLSWDSYKIISFNYDNGNIYIIADTLIQKKDEDGYYYNDYRTYLYKIDLTKKKIKAEKLSNDKEKIKNSDVKVPLDEYSIVSNNILYYCVYNSNNEKYSLLAFNLENNEVKKIDEDNSLLGINSVSKNKEKLYYYKNSSNTMIEYDIAKDSKNDIKSDFKDWFYIDNGYIISKDKDNVVYYDMLTSELKNIKLSDDYSNCKPVNGDYLCMTETSNVDYSSNIKINSSNEEIYKLSSKYDYSSKTDSVLLANNLLYLPRSQSLGDVIDLENNKLTDMKIEGNIYTIK